MKLTKKAYGWPEDAQFLVPPEVPEHFAANLGKRGAENCRKWHEQLAAYEKQFPKEAAELHAMWKGELPPGWDAGIPVFPADAKGMATRISSGKVINGLAKNLTTTATLFLSGSRATDIAKLFTGVMNVNVLGGILRLNVGTHESSF